MGFLWFYNLLGEKLVKNEKIRDESFDFSVIDVVYAW